MRLVHRNGHATLRTGIVVGMWLPTLDVSKLHLQNDGHPNHPPRFKFGGFPHPWIILIVFLKDSTVGRGADCEVVGSPDLTCASDNSARNASRPSSISRICSSLICPPAGLRLLNERRVIPPV